MPNFNDKMASLGKVRSAIRDIFEYGNERRAAIGKENVYDFSLGNPSVPAPAEVNETVKDLCDSLDSITLHGYTSAVGDNAVREKIADDINRRFGAGIRKENIYMTCGAAASLTVTLNALACEGDEFIVFAPFFPEYKVFIEAAGGKTVIVPADTKDFSLNTEGLRDLLSEKTKGVIINSPNNPTGVVAKPEEIKKLCSLLKEKSDEYGHPIYLIADEPYRELVYDVSTVVPYLPNEYDSTIVCYSFSKSLSLPGERIGYIVVPDRCADSSDVFAAVCGAGRALGYVCAPSMMQRVAAACLGKTGDLNAYRRNRDILFSNLTGFGYRCIRPDGAFYLFVESPESDAKAFCERAKKYELLLVPSDSFGTPGFIRISYCVSEEMIRKSLPAFKMLAEEYNLSK